MLAVSVTVTAAAVRAPALAARGPAFQTQQPAHRLSVRGVRGARKCPRAVLRESAKSSQPTDRGNLRIPWRIGNMLSIRNAGG